MAHSDPILGNPAPLPDLHFHWSLQPAASIVIRVRGIVVLYDLLFRSPVTDLVWKGPGWPPKINLCI